MNKNILNEIDYINIVNIFVFKTSKNKFTIIFVILQKYTYEIEKLNVVLNFFFFFYYQCRLKP